MDVTITLDKETYRTIEKIAGLQDISVPEWAVKAIFVLLEADLDAQISDLVAYELPEERTLAFQLKSLKLAG
jgi:hypothetical protein